MVSNNDTDVCLETKQDLLESLEDVGIILQQSANAIEKEIQKSKWS